jgi:hypothetical protein
MPLIQFRIHPSVGMARFGESRHWYFVASEFPFFLQEKFPKLRPQPVARRHPALPADTPPAPDPGRFRDKDGRIMPQAARFRVFAYVYNVGSNEPYNVVEVTPADADIDWTVTVANRKTVRRINNVDRVDLNAPAAVTLTTNPPSAAQKCKTPGNLPNLAWVTLESGTGRLHVIGNEGLDHKDQGPSTPNSLPLYQYDWFDPAADGPVTAVVKPKPAFLSRFPGSKYLLPGVKDPQTLPANGPVNAIAAWVVVNMPDYVPDFGHIVSMWDIALDRTLTNVATGVAKAIDGRHMLVASQTEANHYRIYDYHTHVHPQLAVFTDVTRTSGQARNAAGRIDNAFVGGIRIEGELKAPATAITTTINVGARAAVRLRAASGINPADAATHFTIALAQSVSPISPPHELVRCTAIADAGTLTVTRGAFGTTAAAWPADQDARTTWFAAPPGTFVEAKSTALLTPTATILQVEPVAAHKMRQPSLVAGDYGDPPFLVALIAGNDIEWVICTRNDKEAGALTVMRAQLGTTAGQWPLGTEIVAAGGGHKNFDARKDMTALATGAGGPAHRRFFDRLRLPDTLYARKTFPAAVPNDPSAPRNPATGFPREFGRRYDRTGTGGIDVVVSATMKLIPASMNADAQGSLARHWQSLSKHHQKACNGTDLATGSNAIELLNDMYWIVSPRDMPMLKEYALTQLQYDQFRYWAQGRAGSAKIRPKPLFTQLFSGTPLGLFLNAPHSPDEYFDELQRRLPRYAPAILDMAHLGKMLGGSFLPGIEVGREGGRGENWSLLHGGTREFPDVRFHPAGSSTPHLPGMLTKDLAIPWFNDYILCNESYWPTSRPQIVYEEHGFAYQWLDGSRIGGAPQLPTYWKLLGFIRRNSSGVLVEEETRLELL